MILYGQKIGKIRRLHAEQCSEYSVQMVLVYNEKRIFQSDTVSYPYRPVSPIPDPFHIIY